MTRPLWTISEVIGATGGICKGRMEAAITGVSIDTRTLQPGDLYIALHGVAQDGHKYVDAAFEAGAAARGAIRAFLEVAAPNTAARALYASAGWQDAGLRKDYYRTPKGNLDAILMDKRLSES